MQTRPYSENIGLAAIRELCTCQQSRHFFTMTVDFFSPGWKCLFCNTKPRGHVQLSTEDTSNFFAFASRAGSYSLLTFVFSVPKTWRVAFCRFYTCWQSRFKVAKGRYCKAPVHQIASKGNFWLCHLVILYLKDFFVLLFAFFCGIGRVVNHASTLYLYA